MAVDIRDVARRSGVSVATVSRALNARPGVSAETRDRVVGIARELGYLPNLQARSLVRRRSDTVGLIWDTSYSSAGLRVPFLQDLLIGLKLALADTGYHLMLVSPRAAAADLHAFEHVASQHSLDGVVLMGVDEHLPAVKALISSGLPVIGLDLPVRGIRASYVSTDNRAGAAAAVRHLASLGHRRIATIAGPPDQLPAIDRLEGYRETMAGLELAVPDGYVVHGDYFLDSGRAAMRALLALDERPTAVFVAGDSMAIGACRTVLEAGLDVPGDISIVGYDDEELAAVVRPALTTIRQDYLAMGAATVELLTDLITARHAGGPVDESATLPRLIRAVLIARESSGPAPTAG
ncbi:LacI family DNA-binding transcriptional regulator [Cellulomonas sp. URHD0024]|uniref:LacI family DNA-binding transcriptional regulator n=1 Tax=Cellulomonas sp. URHD0024 TaxID=1302620 RepID=UPI0003F87755|nr:LacI family DNA-binding transcriptional regulator [Cellulomonas sp. URHD0024]